MALDGTVISCMAWELNHALAGGKINKIAQPEKDELMLTIKITVNNTVSLFLPVRAFRWSI